ncbi:MAG: polyphosphate kinase 2 family protein [Thermoplasmata archaeon]|nr:polyphosphate kinase 2 family protein [Thermoplasmata archaeon]
MKQFLLRPNQQLRLTDWDPEDTSGFDGGKEEARKALEKLKGKLEPLQELLYADHRFSLLVVLQGIDTSGKDGTIRAVFEGVNPQGVRVASFKQPSALEVEHDFLWRVHAETPERGEMVIFNRSHYEDVLVTRVHGLLPRATWERRYDEINAFERELTEEGTTILKFFLHISREEQARRLNARLEDPTKHWKFRESDLLERKRWRSYVAAYQEAITRTSTRWAPWCVVPANRKWFRDLVVCRRIVATLESLGLRYPPLPDGFRLTRIR